MLQRLHLEDEALGTGTKAFLRAAPGAYIDGEMLPADTGPDLAVDDPATGTAAARVLDCGPELVGRAVVAARRALEGPWSRLTPREREKLMLDLADAVERDVETLSEIESVESGKSVGMARAVGVGGCAPWLRYMAGWATKIEGSTLTSSIAEPPGSRYHAMTLKQPVGVVGAIVPWNFPLMIAIWKLAPALACGCTIVIKPAEETPLGVLRLAQLIETVGFPKGVVNIVPGRGETTGAALAAHPGVDKLTFTGSTEVGKLVGHAAVDRMARFTLELGGKSPMILLEDFEEGTEGFAAGLGMFFNQGQVCTSASRLLIHSSIYDRTLARLADFANSMRIGSGRDPEAMINPVVSAKHRDRIRGFIDRASAAGAEMVCGARSVPETGYYVAPTILHRAAVDAEIVRDEVFGPVVVAMPFNDLDEAVKEANNSRYGLAASIWTRDLGKAFTAIERIHAGTIWVNAHNIVDPNLPFGGFKQSGIGREHGRVALDAYLETKTVTLRYA